MTTSNDNTPYKYLQFKGTQSYSRYTWQDIAVKRSPVKPQEKNSPDAQSHGSYGALLFHPNWKAKRKEILQRDLHRCVNCSSDKRLQVHHRQYHFMANAKQFRLPWDYPNHLLITLCEPCHHTGHNKYKVPTITI